MWKDVALKYLWMNLLRIQYSYQQLAVGKEKQPYKKFELPYGNPKTIGNPRFILNI